VKGALGDKKVQLQTKKKTVDSIFRNESVYLSVDKQYRKLGCEFPGDRWGNVSRHLN
jgi:hypothetical protein